MDRRDHFIEDLSEKQKNDVLPTIPRNVAVAVFVILSISGILIGAILPDLIDGTDTQQIETEFTKDTLEVIITSSIKELEIAGTGYTNIPVPTAFQVLFLEGEPSEDYSSMDGVLTEMLDFLLGEDAEFSLIVKPGSGMAGSDYILGSGGSGGPDGSAVREVPIGLEEEEGTVVFELKIWGVNLV